MQRIILASQSPRRKMLLKQLGLEFDSVPAHINEDTSLYKNPTEAVRDIARKKAAYVAARFPAELIIAADTVVVCANQVLGKPEGLRDAYDTLRLLSGQAHDVITGVCLFSPTGEIYCVEHEVTRVLFRIISEEEIIAYIKTGEPMDKAGAYGVQGLGSVFVERIEGCYFNVVGLPLSRLYRMLKEQGIAVL